MKTPAYILFTAAAAALIISGCASGSNSMGVTNSRQPGPAVGRAIGRGVGAAAGNVAGAGVGLAEGTAAGVHSAFDNTQRIVRYWREERTADDRIILVPEDFLVDADGRVIRKIK